MKKKTQSVTDFIEDLHQYIVSNQQFRKDTSNKSETDIQREIRPVIINYLKAVFEKAGYKDADAKAHKSFYWEGQEGSFGKERTPIFESRSYPDFIITAPYLLAIEYKQGPYGSLVKQALGQSVIHTLSGDFDYVYILFHDENKNKKIQKSINNKKEQHITHKMWQDYNVCLKFI